VEATSPESEDPGPNDGTDPNWTLKSIVPQAEFALMFMLLWGLIMLPLSMMRYTANKLAQTWLARWLPVDRLADFHVFIGYHMFIQVRKPSMNETTLASSPWFLPITIF
jgi:hypothetical protein